MSYAGEALRSIIEENFGTQLELAKLSGVEQSTISRTMKAKSMESKTIGKIARILPSDERKRLLIAAVRDALPDEYHDEILDLDRGRIREVPTKYKTSPLPEDVQEILRYLEKEAYKDPDLIGFLRRIGKWVGLG